MAFTPAELSSIANAALDFHYKGQPFPQSIQDKPLLSKLNDMRKEFPGGKGEITYPVKGKYDFEGAAPGNGHLTGYTHNDTVAYGNIAGIERANVPWKEVHSGFAVTYTELKNDGISVTDSQSTSKHSRRERTAITNIMQDKVETFSEINAKELNEMLWGDGTADAAGMVGLQYYITATPAVGTTAGIDRAAAVWWRNLYSDALVAGTPGVGEFNIVEKLVTDMRQLRRYGSAPDVALAGSDFLDALVKELRSAGYYTDSGWSRPDSTDISVADIRFKNLKFEYDPTLDDLSATHAKRCYVFPSKDLWVEAMEDEWGKDHTPARPHDQYVLYKAKTYTGNLFCRRLNGCGLFELV